MNPRAPRSFAEASADRERRARAWKADGGRVVGVVCDLVPDELIVAAGMLPFRLAGIPEDGFPGVERYVDCRPEPFTFRYPRLGSVASMLEQLLSGRLDFLDYLVVPHTRTVVAAMKTQLDLARRDDPGLRIPELFYLDKAHSGQEIAAAYERTVIDEFVAQLEAWSGSPLRDDQVARAIVDAEEHRRLLARVVERRRAVPARLDGVSAHQVFSTVATMPRDEHAHLVRALLAEPEREFPGPRVMIGGSPQPDDRLVRAVERTGAVVVAEEHCWGERAAEARLSGTDRDALARRHTERPACSISFPLEREVSACVRRARDARADLVVFHVYTGDVFELWSVPAKRAALAEAGIATVSLAEQDFQATPADVEAAVAGALREAA